MLLVFLLSCGGDSDEESAVESSPTPTAITTADLSDGERVWCEDNLKLVVRAAETLGIEPIASVDQDDPKYKGRPIGSNRAFLTGKYEADFKEANAGVKVFNTVDPEVVYEYLPEASRWPIYGVGFATAYTHSPWNWYDLADYPRACRAAFEADH